jgi:hypothetical protein
MTYAGFMIYTVIAGTLFAFAILWAIAQWLNSTEEEAGARLGEVVRKEERKVA